MEKFRKKPVVVEAEQFFVDKKPLPHCVFIHKGGFAYFVLKDNGTTFPIEDKDWIVYERDGIKVMCPDIFEQNCEKVE